MPTSVPTAASCALGPILKKAANLSTGIPRANRTATGKPDAAWPSSCRNQGSRISTGQTVWSNWNLTAPLSSTPVVRISVPASIPWSKTDRRSAVLLLRMMSMLSQGILTTRCSTKELMPPPAPASPVMRRKWRQRICVKILFHGAAQIGEPVEDVTLAARVWCAVRKAKSHSRIWRMQPKAVRVWCAGGKRQLYHTGLCLPVRGKLCRSGREHPYR